MSRSCASSSQPRPLRSLVGLLGRQWVRQVQTDFARQVFTSDSLRAWLFAQQPANQEVRRLLTDWVRLQVPDLAERAFPQPAS